MHHLGMGLAHSVEGWNYVLGAIEEPEGIESSSGC
jgi:hypothetical protein